MRVVFLLPIVAHARHNKRISALEALGIDPTVLAFERTSYSGKPLPSGYTSLGRIEHRHYYRRIFPLLKAVPVVRAAAKGADALYVFGVDNLLLARLATSTLRTPPKIVCEIGDIFEIQIGAGFASRSLRWLERSLLKRTHLLVVTSNAFVTGYYAGILGCTDLNYQVIENKVDKSTIPPEANSALTPRSDGVLHIGYFGILRCQRSWKVLRECAVQGNGRVQIHLRGLPRGLDDFESTIQETPNISYGGPYVSPDDLPNMYQQVDLAWIATYISKTHSMWARTNRFYEASYFRRPMIAQAGTQDGLLVEQKGVGVCVDVRDVDASVARVLSLEQAKVTEWQKNVATLPERVSCYTDEHEKLVEQILNAKPSTRRQ